MAGFPGARAAVLGRLWGAVCRESLPGVASRRVRGDTVVVSLRDGRRLAGPSSAAVMFAPYPTGLTVTVDGVGFDDPARLARAVGWPERLRAELAGSVANIALARTGSVPPGSGLLADMEARVVDGHPLHPLCRTRTGMSAFEQVMYAPEHCPTVDVDLVPVPARRWEGVGRWPWRDGTDVLLPVHPWQRQHTDLRLPTRGTLTGRPLMSLRTLDVGGGWHVKTAVNIQMTSAVRTVSAAAITNGPVLSVLVAGVGGVEVLAEPAAGAMVVDGVASRQFAAVARRAPVPGAGEVVAPTSALCAGPTPLVVEYASGDPVGWMAALARTVVRPLVELLARGVALEAHGQNTLVVLRDGWPVRAVYRDFGGVRVSPDVLARHGVACPPLAGDIPTNDPWVLRTKFLASVGTMVGEMVAVLSHATGVCVEDLWRPIGSVMADQPALMRGAWPVKATTVMRVARNPLDEVWVWVPNPVKGL
ncbi:MAG: hypothetical protein H0T78_01660 [Longispora sp.]|nr:hypothetical protein [Longispora sp. (in: high G+C Gram-positive bacteria)]